MKRIVGSMRLVLGIMALMVGATQSQQSQDMQTVSFDQLYPASCLKSTLEIAMQVWGDLDMLAEQSMRTHMADRQFTAPLSIDLSIGRLFRMKQCVSRMATRDGQVHADDLNYLAGVLNHVARVAHQLKAQYDAAGHDAHSISCLIGLIDRLHKKLQQ